MEFIFRELDHQNQYIVSNCQPADKWYPVKLCAHNRKERKDKERAEKRTNKQKNNKALNFFFQKDSPLKTVRPCMGSIQDIYICKQGNVCVSWCCEPRQSLGIVSRLKTNSNPSLHNPAHKKITEITLLYVIRILFLKKILHWKFRILLPQ